MISSQIKELQSATCNGLGNLTLSAATAFANLIVAFYCSWKLTLCILATLPPSSIILHLLSRNLVANIETQKEELSSASKYAISSINAIDMVTVHNGADEEIWRYSEAVKRSMRAYLVQSQMNAYQTSYTKFWLESLFVVGFFVGVVLVTQGASVGPLVTTFYASLGALQAIESFIPMYLILAKGLSAGHTLRNLTSDSSTGGSVQKTNTDYGSVNAGGRIELCNVRYTSLSHDSMLKPSRSTSPTR